jgi:hypothetical protein
MKIEVHTGFWWAYVKERHHLKYLGVAGRVMLKWILKNLDWIYVAQTGDQ